MLDWKTIMEMENPHEALKAIAKKIDTENLSIEEMENCVEEYAAVHGIDVDRMAFYPNGGRVLDPDDILSQEYEAKLGKISYYKRDGTLVAQEELTADHTMGTLGMMVRCIMKNGDICEGYSDIQGPPNRRNGLSVRRGILYLWTWTNLDEKTHRLMGDEKTKYDQTFTPIAINKIVSMDAILYSNPRWGGGLTNRFFL